MAGLTVGIPRELVQRGRRVIRPRDLADRYTNPRAEVARMARNGVLHRIATGYYAVPPLNRLGDPRCPRGAQDQPLRGRQPRLPGPR